MARNESEQNASMTEEEMLAVFRSLFEKDGKRVSMTDPYRFEAMKFSYLAIKRAVRDSGCKAKVTCKQSDLAPDVGSVSIEGEEVEINGIRNLEWFCRAAEFANNTEVYPLVDGKIRITLGFNGIVKPISSE